MKNMIIILIIHILFFIACSEDKAPTAPQTNPISIGTLYISPDDILANYDSQILVRLNVPPNIKLTESSVRLVKIVDSSSPVELATLNDNGDLTNGDKVRGDNIYSATVNIKESSVGEITLQVLAKVEGLTTEQRSDTKTVKIYSDLTSEEFNDLISTQDEAVDKLDQLMNNNIGNFETAFNETVDWLKSNPKVDSVEVYGSSISIKYKSGLYGGIMISKEDENGNVITKGGFVVGDRKKSPKIPLNKQTRGTNDYYGFSSARSLNKIWDHDPELIGNRNVLIYSPFEGVFGSSMRESAVRILKQSEHEFAITTLIKEDANVAAIYSLTNYGLVILDTHGSGGTAFLSGEIVDKNATIYKVSYKAKLKARKLAIWKNEILSVDGKIIKSRGDVYGIHSSFISSLPGNFPNSVIINGSCYSAVRGEIKYGAPPAKSKWMKYLYNTFINKGCKTYYGFTDQVGTTFCSQMTDTVVKRLTVDLLTTVEAWERNIKSLYNPLTKFIMLGDENLHYPNSLINGDFEFGKLDGWAKSGDGRVINKLGSQSPAGGKFMGIISTGLGYTNANSKIFQSFRIKKGQTELVIKWNFLSEEFLEYINSYYQDYFKVYIKIKNGTENELMKKTIDQIASDYGAQKFNGEKGEVPQPGNLIFVSPAISFDDGDVYMTNWVTSTYDISAYQDKVVTLILTAGNSGDSIFDTAILLDDISIN